MVLNNKIPKLAETLKKFEKDYIEIEKNLLILKPIIEILPEFFVEFENLKAISFKNGTIKERENNNKTLRNYLRLHETIEFEIRGYKDKKEPLYEALMAILRDKKTTFDNLIDLFYKK